MLKRTLRNALALLLIAAALLPAPAYARDEMQNTDPEKYYIEVDTGNQVVTVYQKDDEGEYTRIVRRFICTTGKLRNRRRTRNPHPYRQMEDRNKGAVWQVRKLCRGIFPLLDSDSWRHILPLHNVRRQGC